MGKFLARTCHRLRRGNPSRSGVASRISLGIGALGPDGSGRLVGKPETIRQRTALVFPWKT
jgi:hypothetical protein